VLSAQLGLLATIHAAAYRGILRGEPSARVMLPRRLGVHAIFTEAVAELLAGDTADLGAVQVAREKHRRTAIVPYPSPWLSPATFATARSSPATWTTTMDGDDLSIALRGIGLRASTEPIRALVGHAVQNHLGPCQRGPPDRQGGGRSDRCYPQERWPARTAIELSTIVPPGRPIGPIMASSPSRQSAVPAASLLGRQRVAVGVAVHHHHVGSMRLTSARRLGRRRIDLAVVVAREFSVARVE
jgi:hypothetical protein